MVSVIKSLHKFCNILGEWETEKFRSATIIFIFSIYFSPCFSVKRAKSHTQMITQTNVVWIGIARSVVRFFFIKQRQSEYKKVEPKWWEEDRERKKQTFIKKNESGRSEVCFFFIYLLLSINKYVAMYREEAKKKGKKVRRNKIYHNSKFNNNNNPIGLRIKKEKKWKLHNDCNWSMYYYVNDCDDGDDEGYDINMYIKIIRAHAFIKQLYTDDEIVKTMQNIAIWELQGTKKRRNAINQL